MKKLFSILALATCLTISAQTTPRFGTTPSRDNTGRTLTYALTTTVDAAAATIDTVNFQPNAFETVWYATLSDSCVVKFSSTTTTYRVGDSFTIFLSKGTGNGRIRLGGSKFIGSTAAATGIALPANKKMYVRYRWNGSHWIECERMVEP